MEIHRDKNIANETLVMDEAAFFECSLRDCKLVYSGGVVVLKDTTMHGCRWEFGGAALNTIELLTNLGLLKGFPDTWSGAVLQSPRHNF